MGKISERLKNKLRRRSPGKAEEMWMLVNSHKNWYHAVPAVTAPGLWTCVNSDKICVPGRFPMSPRAVDFLNSDKICVPGRQACGPACVNTYKICVP